MTWFIICKMERQQSEVRDIVAFQESTDSAADLVCNAKRCWDLTHRNIQLSYRGASPQVLFHISNQSNMHSHGSDSRSCTSLCAAPARQNHVLFIHSAGKQTCTFFLHWEKPHKNHPTFKLVFFLVLYLQKEFILTNLCWPTL